jgi:PleD family two-component response regulator
MRVLLIESEPEDAAFLRDVLVEIGEGQYGNNWVNVEILEATSWTLAVTILQGEPVDIILLGMNIETFRQAQSAAPNIPIVLLVGAHEESLALELIRDGAQDYLVKKQVDCAPLAHAMRNAIKRHHLLTASRAGSTRDSLTGLLNRAGFLISADRDRKLAHQLGRRLMLLIAEIHADQDLAVLEAADHLRSIAAPSDLLARIDPARFAMTVFDAAPDSIEAARTRIQTALRPHRIHLGSAIFSPDHPTTLDALMEHAIPSKAAQASNQ